MRAIGKYYHSNDEFVHPLWLGTLILFIVMTIIGIICCLRIKCGSQLSHLLNRLFGRNNETNENSSNDDGYSTISYSYNWPPIYTSTRSQSPKLYKLVKNIRRANLQKQLASRQQSNKENENESEMNSTIEADQLPQISPSSLTDGTRNSEIARKFYASMRNTSQGQNSSVDSYNDSSVTNPTSDQPINSNQEGNIKLFRTPRFFKSISNQNELVIGLQ